MASKNYNSCFDFKLMKKTAEALESTYNNIYLESFGSSLETSITYLESYDKTHSAIQSELDNLQDFVSKIKSCGNELSNLCTGIQEGIKAYNDAEGNAFLFLGAFANTIEKYLGNKTVAEYLRDDKIVNKNTFTTDRDEFLAHQSDEVLKYMSEYTMYIDQNCPSGYNSSEEWRQALIEKYKNMGYSSYDASDLAYAEMSKWRIEQTGATVASSSLSVIATNNLNNFSETVKKEYDGLVDKYKKEGYNDEQARKLASLESEYNDAVSEVNEHPSDNASRVNASKAYNELQKLKEEYGKQKVTESGADMPDKNATSNSQVENSTQSNGVSTKQTAAASVATVATPSSSTSSSPSNIAFRVEENTSSTSNQVTPPSEQQKVETPAETTPQNPSNNTNNNNTNDNQSSGNENNNSSDNPDNTGSTGNNNQQQPSTGDNAGTNNGSSTKPGSGTSSKPESPTTGNNNTGSNQGNENNSGVIDNNTSNNPSGNTSSGNTNASDNTYYGPSNNTSNNAGTNYGNSRPTIIPSPDAGNNNAATTTPSAPESDAGIIDNSGETLDVISIDKDTNKSQPSTSSNDGGSVIPIVLGVGAAGAAAVAGAKFIHDKKEKENTYIYEEDTNEENNSSSYETEDQSDNDSYGNIIQSDTKYKAGNVNKLILDEAPKDLNIENNIPDNSKEELE